VFTSLEDTGGLSWVAGTEGFVRLLQGRLVEARDLAGSLLPLGDAMGERWGVAALLTIDALAAAELGDIAAATDEATRARERFEEVGDAWGQTLALTAAGIAARGADQPEDALALLDAAAALAEKEHFPMTQSLALVAGGYASLDCGDVNGAEGRAWRASAVLAGLDLEPHATLGAKVLLAQAMRIRGQREQALAELDAALAVSDQPGLLFPRRQALAHRAGTLLELGRVDEGLAAAREAVGTHAEDVRSRVLALRALGSALKATGDLDGARSSYDEALAVATSTGQRSEIAATEALIAALD
jgi:tetratricopeptide (TPR) repeat protein